MIVKKKIADLERKIEVRKAEDDGVVANPTKSKKEKNEDKVDLDLNPFYKEMESQLTATELEIKRLNGEESRIKVRIAEFQARIENTPVRELAIANLTRDYHNTKETYHSLLKKSQEAQQAENLERRQKGEQFKVIDPARIPEKPFKPNIPKILLFGIFLGIGSGFGMAFFREQMDHSFRDAEDLEASLGFKVLATIPKSQEKAVFPVLERGSTKSYKIRNASILTKIDKSKIQREQRRSMLLIVILIVILMVGTSFILWKEPLLNIIGGSRESTQIVEKLYQDFFDKLSKLFF